MFNNTSRIKPRHETTNHKNILQVIIDIPFQNKTARVQMDGDEWQNVQAEMNQRIKNASLEKNRETVRLNMMFFGRKAILNLSEKELKCLHEVIMEMSDCNPKRVSDKVRMNMQLQGRNARVEMSKGELARWLCLVESIDLIEKKCEEMNVRMSDDFWIQPIAIQKYMDSRFHTMLDEVNHHEFGIDTKKANLNILRQRQQLETSQETAEEEPEEMDVQLSRTSYVP